MKERTRTLTVKLDDAEINQAHALAEDGDEPISMMLRRWIGERYAARFRDAVPPRAKLRPGPGPRRRATTGKRKPAQDREARS